MFALKSLHQHRRMKKVEIEGIRLMALTWIRDPYCFGLETIGCQCYRCFGIHEFVGVDHA